VRHTLDFIVHRGPYAVCQMPAHEPAPEWAMRGAFWSVSRTPAELSVICEERHVPDGVRSQRGWACIQLAGKFPFETAGVLAAVVEPLAEAGVPVFAMSTYDTDWVLAPGEKLEEAVRALKAAGHNEI
jgi:hypothetical protein